ncbi:MAG: ATP-binding protein [Bacteroidales bacterium]|nr:ATP-binding protein [Bacteroidales bacterium]
MIVMKRKIYKELQKWKETVNGKTAILIDGARRVGKSYIVEKFAKNEYKSYILIDFSKENKEINALFTDYLSDLDSLFRRLSLLSGVKLRHRESVIVFDEVQLFPPARAAIKHLVKDGRYDYIETGSLISIRKNVQNIVIPSEEDRIQMFPMDYEEFREALGDTATIPLLRTFMQKPQPLGDGVNRNLMRDFRLYMLVGGMPQAVETYLETNNLQSVDIVKRKILKLYSEDLYKLDSSEKLRALFWAIPSQLSRNTSRFQSTTVIENVKQYQMQDFLETLRESMIVNVAYNSADPNVGLVLSADRTRYKMYLADTGLFVTLAYWDKDFTENVIYQKLWADKLDTNLGYVYENMAAQMFRAAGYELFYHTFSDGNNHNYEVDFLLSHGNKLVPVEVKSSGYNTHKSLDEFCRKFSSRIGNRYLVYTKDLRRDQETIMMPVYMAGLI